MFWVRSPFVGTAQSGLRSGSVRVVKISPLMQNCEECVWGGRGRGHSTQNSAPKRDPVAPELLGTCDMARGTNAALGTALCLREA